MAPSAGRNQAWVGYDPIVPGLVMAPTMSPRSLMSDAAENCAPNGPRSTAHPEAAATSTTPITVAAIARRLLRTPTMNPCRSVRSRSKEPRSRLVKRRRPPVSIVRRGDAVNRNVPTVDPDAREQERIRPWGGAASPVASLSLIHISEPTRPY